MSNNFKIFFSGFLRGKLTFKNSVFLFHKLISINQTLQFFSKAQYLEVFEKWSSKIIYSSQTTVKKTTKK